MEREQKAKRPRIGSSSANQGEHTRFEKVIPGRREAGSYDSNKGQRPNYSEGYRKPAPSYRPSNGGFRNNEERPSYNNDRQSNYGERSYDNSAPRRSFNHDNEGSNGGFRPRSNDRFGNRDNNGGNSRSFGSEKPYNRDNNNSNSFRPRSNDRFGNRDNNGGNGRSFGSEKPYNRDNNGSENGSRPHFNDRAGGNRNNGGGRSFNNDRSFNGERSFNNNRGERPSQPFKRPQHRDDNYDPNAKYSLKKRIIYQEKNTDPNAPLRLNKYLANAGVCSRREADTFIQAGVVKVNGEAVTELGTKITRADTVHFHDQLVSLERKVYVLLNKPKDCVTTADDPQGRLTVMDIVRNACQERIYPVGRLDRNTTGVLLLTNDGELASKLTHPKFVKKKIYHVWTDKDVTEEDMQKIADGIELEDGMIHADAISYANEEDRNQVGIEIHSGKNRIVRRIFESLGYHVVRLDRVLFAGLTKKNLPRGRWRHLTQQEVSMLQMGAFE